MRLVDLDSSCERKRAEAENRPADAVCTDDDLHARTSSFTHDDQPASFRLLGAAAIPGQSAKSAVVVSCPHAGRYYPETLVTAGSVGIEALRDLEDFAVDRLLDGLSCTNIAGISSNIARAYLDVNRPEDALDPAMFDEPVSAAKQSRKVMAGYGLLPRLTGARSLIHDHLLPADEIQQRIALAYRPYHSQLKQLLDNARQQHQRYLLVDCHSMPDVDHQNKRLPDVVLGDCHGRTLAPEIGKALDDYIRALGFSLGWNNPYSGGFITGHYGSATSSGQSLQIEINRALYMRNPHQLDKEGAARVTALLTDILTFLDALAS